MPFLKKSNTKKKQHVCITGGLWNVDRDKEESENYSFREY